MSKTLDKYTKNELEALYESLRKTYDEAASKGLKLDMSRGKPAPSQFSLAKDILCACTDIDDLTALDGTDCRNYGGGSGIKEAKDLFSEIIGVPASNIYIGGVSSLNLMYDTISRAMLKGLATSEKPWSSYEKIKFICPVPGYDRHYAILDYFGIELIPVPFLEDGPDMDMVEKIVAEDENVRGMWIIPVYSNPTGTVYSDEVLRRIASMPAKANDFTVFCDNAYPLHTIKGEFVEQTSFYDECVRAGHPERPYVFASFSKVTFSGGSISCVACGDRNLAYTSKAYNIQCITNDKINQLRHTRVFRNKEDVKERMLLQASYVRPKFELVIDTMKKMLGETGCAHWSDPDGGYFIALYLDLCSAKRVYELCSEAGVKLTPAGAGYPGGIDPDDAFIRIAPTYPEMDELKTAAELLCTCILLASCEKLLDY